MKKEIIKEISNGTTEQELINKFSVDVWDGFKEELENNKVICYSEYQESYVDKMDRGGKLIETSSFIKSNNGYPRISLTVPSIVIMVPGLYLYRAIYNFGIMSLTEAVSWFSLAIMIIMALPLGLIFARILTDKTFRYCT